MTTLPKINPKPEVEKIVDFLKSVQKKTGINKVVIGLSGGVDSTTVCYLLKKAYKPENIIGISLPYDSIKSIVNQFIERGSIRNFLTQVGPLPQKRKKFVFSPLLKDEVNANFSLSRGPFRRRRNGETLAAIKFALPSLNQIEKIRLGNIMARVRMIILFDLAKKNNALVCGTENKSERLLGYFTRFGDAASDIEPITHLYKTQVYQLSKYLKVPQKIIDVKPTAGLWKGQTDEGEFGFTYEEADQVLYLYFDKKMATKEIKRLGFKNVEKIIKRFLENKFKQEVPYSVFTLR